MLPKTRPLVGLQTPGQGALVNNRFSKLTDNAKKINENLSLSANLLLRDPRNPNKKKVRFFVLDFNNKVLLYKM